MVLTLDVLSGANENLHNPAVWAYLWMLAKEGKLRILFGGPPCRSTSRLRHRQPGPRPLRGRGPRRFALEDLTEDEERLVHGDSALIFKMLGLFEVMVEAKSGEGEPAFLMEHPSDPADYIAVAEEQDFPSVWNWPEVEKFEKKHNLHRVRFDQGATGHVRRKPTTLCTSLEEMKELDGLKAKGEPKEELKEELSERLVQTASWAAWSPGLVAAVKMAFRNFMKGGPKCKRFTVDEWRQHVRQNHVPFRRDCRVCIEEMGQDLPHRRRKASEAGESAYVLAVDVIGPFKEGWDYGRKETAKYAMVATVPVPISDTVEDPGLEQGGEGVLQELPEEEHGPERDVLDEPLEEEEIADLQEDDQKEDIGKKEYQKLEAERPMKMQLITMVEPMASRQSTDIIRALERVWSNYRFLGVPMYRCHSDRAKEFLARPVQQWMGRHQLKQTMTCGDNPQSNGRVEAEINQVKRRLRLTLRTAKAPIQEWPTVLRHVGEERQRQQLKQVGLRSLPMVSYNQEVLVKTKVWHKRFTQGMASPYYAAKIKGPSPMMSHGWVVQDKEGKIQHARAVLVPDSRADEVMLEFEAADPGPSHRVTGKQSPDPRLRIPLPSLDVYKRHEEGA